MGHARITPILNYWLRIDNPMWIVVVLVVVVKGREVVVGENVVPHCQPVLAVRVDNLGKYLAM